jgi:hypothetical protein
MTREQLLAVVGRMRSLDDATRWALARDFALVEVVTQDEYTHDVVFAAGAHFVVFDTT